MGKVEMWTDAERALLVMAWPVERPDNNLTPEATSLVERGAMYVEPIGKGWYRHGLTAWGQRLADDMRDPDRRVTVGRDLAALGRLMGELYGVAVAARACGLSLDEIVFLLGTQYRLIEEMAACSCGKRWTKADLDENPNAADEHECAAPRCSECESPSDDLKPIADGSGLFCTDCRLRLNPEHR